MTWPRAPAALARCDDAALERVRAAFHYVREDVTLTRAETATADSARAMQVVQLLSAAEVVDGVERRSDCGPLPGVAGLHRDHAPSSCCG